MAELVNLITHCNRVVESLDNAGTVIPIFMHPAPLFGLAACKDVDLFQMDMPGEAEESFDLLSFRGFSAAAHFRIFGWSRPLDGAINLAFATTRLGCEIPGYPRISRPFPVFTSTTWTQRAGTAERRWVALSPAVI